MSEKTNRIQSSSRPTGNCFSKFAFFFLFGIFCLVFTGSTYAQRVLKQARGLKGVGIKEKLGHTIPMDLTFLNSKGKQVTLAELMKGDKPVILNLAYFTCPMLCPLIMHGMVKGLKKSSLVPGKDYKIITVSFDPHDTYQVAAQKKASMDSTFGKYQKQAESSWYFLTGKQDQITQLTKSVGFDYKYLPKKKMFAHTAALIFLSSKGKVDRYLYGISYAPLQLENALGDAAHGKIGSTLVRIVLYCCQYDPGTGKYTASVTNIMKLSGVVVMILLGGLLGILWFKDKKSSNT